MTAGRCRRVLVAPCARGLVAACVVVLGACAPQAGGDGAAADSRPSGSTPTDVTTGAAGRASAPAPAVEHSTEMVATASFPDSAGRDIAFLTAVETGRHEDFDRVVWTFDGETPAYRVAYVERPITEDGSGSPIEVRGDATLQIILTPASGTDLSGEEVRTIYEGPERIDGSAGGTSVVEEVVMTGDFEATLSWVIGSTRPAPFTVTELSDPTRVVIDIASG